MKKSNEFINESVFKVNLKYTRLQNETKELFFRCLDEGRSETYFNKRLNEIWGNIDHSFMDDELEEYKAIIHDNNMQLMTIAEPKTEEQAKKEDTIFDIISAVVIAGYELKLKRQKEKEYRSSLKSPAYQNDKDRYLSMKVEQYNSSIVPYYVKRTGEVREVPLNVYASMIHNTNLTRSAWNQTLNDGNELFYIPFHSFSCPHCLQYQNHVYTREEVENVLLTKAMEQEGDLLHPNCKCVLVPYIPGLSTMNKPNYDEGALEEQYKIRQKMNSLTLEKERLKTDINIQKRFSQEEVDELNKQRNKINRKIRELKQELPTEELQKQVVAINRNY